MSSAPRSVASILALSSLVLSGSAAPDSSLRFVDGGGSSGLDFGHRPHRTEDRRMPEVLGSGVVVADFNRDGAPDVVLVNSGDLTAGSRPDGAENRLYLNDGNGRFSDRTAAWELPSPGYGMGGTAADFDNDGWPDLFLTTVAGPDTLLRNVGGRFVDVTEEAGITQDGRWSSSAGFFDLEGDGDLDLWVVRYLDYSMDRELPCFANRVRVYCTPVLLDGLPGRLWRNLGNGTFEDASALIASASGKGLALLLADIDRDGDTDTYVAHDTTPNHLWLNDGEGGLREVGLPAGVAVSEMGAELAGMGVDLTDVDGDGRLDLAVTNFQGETTTVYLQKTPGLFQERSDAIGIGRVARARLSFGVEFFDADNDGDEDLLVANGHLYDNVRQIRTSEAFEQQNTLYEALTGGEFADVSDRAGPALQAKAVSRGLAIADWNGDGGLDYIVNNSGGKAQVGINATPGRRNFIHLRLDGRRANRSAIGARVVARAGDVVIERQVVGASSYLSTSDLGVHLGIGGQAVVDEVTIHWPGSESQNLSGLSANRHYLIVEGESPQEYEPGTLEVGTGGID